jgi:hypothetical protein
LCSSCWRRSAGGEELRRANGDSFERKSVVDIDRHARLHPLPVLRLKFRRNEFEGLLPARVIAAVIVLGREINVGLLAPVDQADLRTSSIDEAVDESRQQPVLQAGELFCGAGLLVGNIAVSQGENEVISGFPSCTASMNWRPRCRA